MVNVKFKYTHLRLGLQSSPFISGFLTKTPVCTSLLLPAVSYVSDYSSIQYRNVSDNSVNSQLK